LISGIEMNAESLICDLAVPGVRQLIPYKPGKPVEELERELGIKEIVKLASNENPLGPGPKAIEAIQNTLPELARYPDGNAFHLKQAIADRYGVKTSQIVPGNGSNEILEILARTFLTPNQEVIFSQHAFAVYPLVTQAIGAVARVAPAKNYGHDLEAMAALITPQTRLVFIANPNNPTGTLLDASELESFIAALPGHVICVLDEAYYEFVDSDLRADSVAWLDRFPNLVITRTFSKAYGLAGLRCGFSLSSPIIADLMNRVRQPFNNNMLALAAARAALSDEAYLQQTLDVNRQGMQQLTTAFKDMNLNWIPSFGNFVSVDMNQTATPLYEKLLRQGVIVRPVANYEMPNHLRISIGTEAENQVFISALRTVLADV
jgi:histidinol-phosphate aminotransferase